MEIHSHTHKCARNNDTRNKSCQLCLKHYVVPLIAAVILVLISAQPSRAQTEMSANEYFRRTYKELLSDKLYLLSRAEWCVVAPLTGNWPSSQPPIGWEYPIDQAINFEKCWLSVSILAIFIKERNKLAAWVGSTKAVLEKPVIFLFENLLARGASKNTLTGYPVLLAGLLGISLPKLLTSTIGDIGNTLLFMVNGCINLGYSFPTPTDLKTLLINPDYFIERPTDPLGFTVGRSCSRDAAKLWFNGWADRGYKNCADCCRDTLWNAMSGIRDTDDALSQLNACLAICDANFNPSACARFRENAECGYDPCGEKIGDCRPGTSCNPATRKCDSCHCCGIGDKCTSGPACDLRTGKCRQPETTSRGSSSSASGGSSSSASGGSSSSSVVSSSSAPPAQCPEPWNHLARDYECAGQDPATCLEMCGDYLERDPDFLKLPKHEQISCVTRCPQPDGNP